MTASSTVRKPLKSFAWACLAPLAILMAPVSASAGLLLQYNFEEGAGTTTSSSTANTAPLTLGGGAAFGAEGTGVSNTGRALSLPDAGNFSDNRAHTSTAADIASLNGSTSYTISGWFNRSVAGGGSGRIIQVSSSSGAGFYLANSGATALQFQTRNAGNTANVDAFSSGTSQQYYDDVNSYVFIAVTVDTTATSNQVKFYEGTEGNAVRFVSQNSFAANTLATLGTLSTLTLGNTQDFNRSFGTGRLDDIRFYGETSGSTGALSLVSLEEVRAAAVPEPASLGLLAMGALPLLRRRSR
jgi:hypothetical protein